MPELAARRTREAPAAVLRLFVPLLAGGLAAALGAAFSDAHAAVVHQLAHQLLLAAPLAILGALLVGARTRGAFVAAFLLGMLTWVVTAAALTVARAAAVG